MAGNSKKSASGRPDRRLRLLLWVLLYKIPPLWEISRENELNACAHCRVSWEFLNTAKKEFPVHWARMLAKRERRRAFVRQHGFVHDGWTPPDPNDPRSRYYPAWALERRAKGEDKMIYLLRLALRKRWEMDGLGEQK
ncbi:MAG TPA: hypothetical protein VHY22_04620 [Chthoniobacteraceae bacterium]|jgi:hypothetical protein|nr:hypothetical protein [Chthoniobacteraceae bacterium]